MTRMACLGLAAATLIIATITVADAQGPLSSNCNRTAMLYDDDVKWDKFSGDWYVQYFSYNSITQSPIIISWAFEVANAINPAMDKFQMEGVSFKVFSEKYKTNSWMPTCTSAGSFISEVIDGRAAFSYSVEQRGTPTYYVGYRSFYVLDTDYDSTAVMFLEPNLDGTAQMDKSIIQVWTRKPNAAPAQAVVKSALQDFCEGPMLQLNSGSYYKVANRWPYC